MVNRVWLKDLICSGLGHTHTHTQRWWLGEYGFWIGWFACEQCAGGKLFTISRNPLALRGSVFSELLRPQDVKAS